MSRASNQSVVDERVGRSAAAPTEAPTGALSGAAWMAAAALVLATLFVFWPAVHCDSVNFDDPSLVFGRPQVLAGLTRASVHWALTSTAAFYMPLTNLSFLLDASLWGPGPWGFHLTNIVLHAVNAGLLLLLLVRMAGRWGAALLAAALFALHPLRVESVVWITERKDVLSLFFALLTLHAWVSYTRRPSLWRYGAAAALFAAALLAKAQVLTLPLLLLLLDYWPLERGPWPRGRAALRRWGVLVLEKTPLLVLTALSAVSTMVFQSQLGAVSSLEKAPLAARVSNALVSVWRYIARLVRVDELAVYYPWAPGWGAGVTLAAAAGLVLVTAAVVWQRRERPWLLVGWLWFLVALFPVIGIVQAGPQALADRYTYFSMIGLAIALAWSVPDRWLATPPRRAVCAGAALLALVALSIFTRVQIGYWRDSVSLWRHDLGVTGNKNTIGLGNLGCALLDIGQDEQAAKQFELVLRASPRDSLGHANLGLVWTKRGLVSAAISEFREALRWDPNNRAGLNALTLALLESDKPGEATQYARRLARIVPDDPVVWAQLGNALARSGSTAEAEQAFNRAAELAPDLPGVALGRAELATLQGRYDDAWRLYSSALAAHPDNSESWFRAGEFLGERGQHDQAIQHLRKALELAPGNNDARINLGIELAAQGHAAEAIDEYRRVLERRPDDADAHLNLAAALAATGSLDQALEHAGRAVAIRPNVAAAQYDYGALLARAGRPQLALEHLEAAARLNPGDPDTVGLIARLRAAPPAASRPAGPVNLTPAAAAAR